MANNIHYTVAREYGRIIQPPKNMARNFHYTGTREHGRQHPLLETLSSLKTTRAWEASVLYNHLNVWPITSTP